MLIYGVVFIYCWLFYWMSAASPPPPPFPLLKFMIYLPFQQRRWRQDQGLGPRLTTSTHTHLCRSLLER